MAPLEPDYLRCGRPSCSISKFSSGTVRRLSLIASVREYEKIFLNGGGSGECASQQRSDELQHHKGKPLSPLAALEPL